MSVDTPPNTRLIWRCRRGMKELDLILSNYLKQRYPTLPASQQQDFEHLLDASDDTLWHYLCLNRTPSDPTIATLVFDIRRAAAHRS